MFNTINGMSICVSGGSVEENNQLCTVVASLLQNNGFNDVQLSASNEYFVQTHYDHNLVSAMRKLNPDLFDTKVNVYGESEEDLRADLLNLGLSNQPIAFQVSRTPAF